MDVTIILNQIKDVEDNIPVGGGIDPQFLSILTPQELSTTNNVPDENWYGYIENAALVRNALASKFTTAQIPNHPQIISEFYKLFVVSRIDVMSCAIENFILQNYKMLFAEHYMQSDLEGITAIKNRSNISTVTGAAIQFYLHKIIVRCLQEIDLSMCMAPVMYSKEIQGVMFTTSQWDCIKLGRGPEDVRLVNALYDKVSLKLIGIIFEM